MTKPANLLFLLFSAAVSPQTLFLHNNNNNDNNDNNNNNMDMEANDCNDLLQWCLVRKPNSPGFYPLNFLQYTAVNFFEIVLLFLLVLPPTFFITFLLYGLGTGDWEPFEKCLPKSFSKRSAYEEI